MARKAQENDLGNLPPELLVGDQEVGEKLQVDVQGSENITDTDTDTDTDGELGQETEGATVADGRISVVVNKGNTVRHDGHDYTENRTFTVFAEDAHRLIGLGVVADVEQLRKLALTRAVPTVSVQSGE